MRPSLQSLVTLYVQPRASVVSNSARCTSLQALATAWNCSAGAALRAAQDRERGGHETQGCAQAALAITGAGMMRTNLRPAPVIEGVHDEYDADDCMRGENVCITLCVTVLRSRGHALALGTLPQAQGSASHWIQQACRLAALQQRPGRQVGAH